MSCMLSYILKLGGDLDIILDALPPTRFFRWSRMLPTTLLSPFHLQIVLTPFQFVLPVHTSSVSVWYRLWSGTYRRDFSLPPLAVIIWMYPHPPRAQPLKTTATLPSESLLVIHWIITSVNKSDEVEGSSERTIKTHFVTFTGIRATSTGTSSCNWQAS